MTDDFTMYKGTTQPVYISVFYEPVPPATTGLPADLSMASDALWVCVDAQHQVDVLKKRVSTSDITIIAQPGAVSSVTNTLYFNIHPTDDTVLVPGQYDHEARVIFGNDEFVVYPYPPPTTATFTVYKSLTRGAEPGHTAQVSRPTTRMPPAFLNATMMNQKLWPEV
jgi:hypothetical protein